MSRSVLIVSYEVPGWGGASSRAYLLFERLQRDGWDVAFLNLVRRDEERFLRGLFGARFGNPRGLANVHTQILDEPVWGEQAALAATVREIEPDVALAFGFTAANLLLPAAPGIPLVYTTVAVGRVQALVEAGAVADFIAFRASVEAGVEFLPPAVDRERRAIEACDLVIVHSPIVRFTIEHCFPEARARIHPRTISLADLVYESAESFAMLRRPFAERDIDLLFIASHWRRPTKGYGLVREIAERSAARSIHVVGGFTDSCPNAVHHGVVTDRTELFALIGRTKVLACPSQVEGAAGVLFEASAMGCNVVASENCGNWELCNDELLARTCDAAEFTARIERGLERRYADHRDRFAGGYDDLVKILNEL